MKLGVLNGLILRAQLLCDLKDVLLDELNLLRYVFVSNSYPCQLLNRSINKLWWSELKWAVESIRKAFQDYESGGRC